MNTTRIVRLTLAAGIGAATATSLLASGCYYTSAAVCVPAGTIIWQRAVQCYWGSGYATLFDENYTEANAYGPIAASVAPPVMSGNVGKITATFVNTVSYGTRRVDPRTCNITITPRVGTVTFSCTGEAADPDSEPCYIVEVKPSILDSYSALLVANAPDAGNTSDAKRPTTT